MMILVGYLSLRTNLLGYGLGSFQIYICECQLAPQIGKFQCHQSSDATTRSGDEHVLVPDVFLR
jgi:hypothetical protein